MKEGIHPKFHEVEARCACGATWKTHSTKPELHLEICSSCHPFFTGKQKLLDTEGRVERFTKKYGVQTSESRKKAAKARKNAGSGPRETYKSEVGGLKSERRLRASNFRLSQLSFLSILASRCWIASTPALGPLSAFSRLCNANSAPPRDLARGARGGLRAPRSPRARAAAGSRGPRAGGASRTRPLRSAAPGATPAPAREALRFGSASHAPRGDAQRSSACAYALRARSSRPPRA